MTSYCRRPANFAAHERPTVGDTKFSFTDFNHLGWLKCDGSLLSKTEYALLYNVIGGTFGETSTQFRLPDPRGRVLGTVGSGSGLTTRSKGDEVGEETHQLTIPEMPSHNHTGTTDSNGEHSHNITSINDDFNNSGGNSYPNQQQASFGGFDQTGSKTWTHMVGSNGSHTHTFTTSNTGGDQPHNNMQPTLFYGNMFIYCGKVNDGSFPYTTGTDLF